MSESQKKHNEVYSIQCHSCLFDGGIFREEDKLKIKLTQTKHNPGKEKRKIQQNKTTLV